MKFVAFEVEIEPLPRCRDLFAGDYDLVADKLRSDLAGAIIFEQMRPQAPAILAIDNGAFGCARVALVRSDQFEGIAEQRDVFVIDRGHRSNARADQAHGIVAAANAGLEHREIAFALSEIQAGQRKHRLERPELSGLPR